MNFPSPIFALGQGLEIIPFMASICIGGVLGFILGVKKQRWLIMWFVCVALAAFGVWLVGPIGWLAGFLTPLLYYYGRYS